MMKFAAIALLASSAAAFAPSKVAQTSTALNAFENELGVQPPLDSLILLVCSLMLTKIVLTVFVMLN